uniref:TOX high mobility group box family member 4 n=1 Tax=Colobus angolensis palliatus TaxID=336983 RepID=A0A2K5KB69_COLAP
NDIYLMITGPSHPFLSGAETFHTPSLGDEEFEISPISLDSDSSLAVSDVVDHFDDLADPSSSQNGSFSIVTWSVWQAAAAAAASMQQPPPQL